MSHFESVLLYVKINIQPDFSMSTENTILFDTTLTQRIFLSVHKAAFHKNLHSERIYFEIKNYFQVTLE